MNTNQNQRGNPVLTSELQPCPFCGCIAEIYDYEAESAVFDKDTLGFVEAVTRTLYGVGCPVCGCIIVTRRANNKPLKHGTGEQPMKHNNKLPYRERVRHAAYRDTYTQRSEEIQIRKEIKRMEKDKAQANEPPMSEKEREFAEKCELLRKLQEGIDEDEAG